MNIICAKVIKVTVVPNWTKCLNTNVSIEQKGGKVERYR